MEGLLGLVDVEDGEASVVRVDPACDGGDSGMAGVGEVGGEEDVIGDAIHSGSPCFPWIF
jgi:hypothetical protein